MDLRSSDEAVRRDIPSFIEPRPPLIHHPFMRPRPEKGINLLEKFEEDSDIEEPELVQVYLRMKPCKIPGNLYELRSDKCLVTSLDTATVGHGRRTQHNVSKMYTFSRIFKPECSQKEIFDEVVKGNLNRLVDGHSFTLLTYGASGSGKTYTIMGTVNSPGLVPRALEYLFKLVDAAQTPLFKPSETGTDKLGYTQQEIELQWVKRLLQISAPFREKYRRMSAQLCSDLTVSNIDLTNRTKYYVWVSFVEIYNEAIYDLLAPPDKRAKLRLREDSTGNVYVKGVTQAFVRSGEEAYDVMVAGKHNLVVAATGIHAHSSRSHCIFTITLLTETGGEIRTSQVRLCDLAGCERQRAARNTGARMQESRAINSSLHVLERCLHMLRRKQRFSRDCAMVPYRECKLTRLLGSGLSGARGEAVSMVVTLNPAPQHAHETRHVLSLAVVARDIQINNTMDPTVTMASSLECTQDSTQDFSDEIMRLRTENERLHFEKLQAQSLVSQMQRSLEEKQQQNAAAMLELVEETKDMMRDFYEKQITNIKAQLKETEEYYESKLDELQAEIRMMRALIPEEKLANGSFAKSMEMQRELQHTEERAENENQDSKSPSPEREFEDSSSECDSDADNLDESLEPVNHLRRSILHKDVSVRHEAVIDLINESTEDEDESQDEFEKPATREDAEEAEKYLRNDETISKDEFGKSVSNEVAKLPDISLRNDDAVSKDSLYATGDEISETENQSKIENDIESAVNVSLSAYQIKPDSATEIETDKNVKIDTNADKDKSDYEELFNESTKFYKTQDIVVEKSTVETSLRGTFCIKRELHNDDEQKLKTLNMLRGTYFVAERDMSFYKETHIDSHSEKKESPVNNKENTERSKILPDSVLSNKKLCSENEKLPAKDVDSNEKLEEPVKNKEPLTKGQESLTDTMKPKIIANTLVSKIIKSFKTRQTSESSLQQFEQLELAVNSADNTTDAVKSFELAMPTQILKRKKYFDETAKLSPTAVHDKPTKETGEKTGDNNKLKYFEDKPGTSKFCQLSSAAVTQEKRLLFDSPESTIPEEKDLPTETNMQSLILTPKIVKPAQLFYTEHDKIPHKDILISRSPSIVRDEVPQEYEPSVAITKILGESFTKPEILSSARKERLASKKHESVDIFESPFSTKTISKEITKDNAANKKGEEPRNVEEDANSNELISVTKLKGKSVEIAHEFIESLVARQNIKAYIEREKLATENNCIPQAPVANKKDNELIKEIKQEQVTLERTTFTEISTTDKNNTKEIEGTSNAKELETKLCLPLNDTVSSKGNNTVDEFENIVKDLTNVRATDFDLLVTEEDIKYQEVFANKAIKQEKEVDIKEHANPKDKTETEQTERRKKFEEAKYNLRNKGKSTNLNLSDEKKDQVTESTKSKTKRSLRLRRNKNIDDDNSEKDDEKLKDILNLKKEFSDVTLGVPAEKKVVIDIPSPEKVQGEEENLPPLGIQSCPSKSVTRSRRKLFTPRAEPLEESPSQVGDSNERIYIPRPSYHRVRARRKL